MSCSAVVSQYPQLLGRATVVQFNFVNTFHLSLQLHLKSCQINPCFWYPHTRFWHIDLFLPMNVYVLYMCHQWYACPVNCRKRGHTHMHNVQERTHGQWNDGINEQWPMNITYYVLHHQKTNFITVNICWKKSREPKRSGIESNIFLQSRFCNRSCNFFAQWTSLAEFLNQLYKIRHFWQSDSNIYGEVTQKTMGKCHKIMGKWC